MHETDEIVNKHTMGAHLKATEQKSNTYLSQTTREVFYWYMSVSVSQPKTLNLWM